MNRHPLRVVCVAGVGFGVAALAGMAGMVLPESACSAQQLQRLIGTPSEEQFNGATAIGVDGFVAVGRMATTTGDDNMLVMRLDSAGRKIWARVLETGAYDEAFSVIRTLDGNIVLAGVSRSDPTRTIVVVKMDLAGNVLWANKLFGDNSLDVVADFHPIVTESPQGRLFVIGHHAEPSPNGFTQFGRLISLTPAGTVGLDIQFNQVGEPPMISPSDIEVVSSADGIQGLLICGTKRDIPPGGAFPMLRRGFLTLYVPGVGFVSTTEHNGVDPAQGVPLDLSFHSLSVRGAEPVVFVNGMSQVEVDSLDAAALMAIPPGVVAPAAWALHFRDIVPAQAGLVRANSANLVWTGSHIFGDGGQLAQLQSTDINGVALWNYEYRYPFNSASGALVVEPSSRDNVMFGRGFDFNLGYGGSDALFIRADQFGRLPNTQCPEQLLEPVQPWSPQAKLVTFLGTQVPPVRPWEFVLREPSPRDNRVCPTPGGCCIGDIASDSLDVVYNPNGSIGAEDLDAFIAGFIANNVLIADVASDSLDTTCNPNGAVGAEDLDAFIASFISGVCP